MKRHIRYNIPVLGMSFSRKRILDRLDNYSDLINEHLCKCIIYGPIKNQLFGKYDHWITEIAQVINAVNSMTLDGKKKLKESDYRQLFAAFGTTLQDAETNITLQYVSDRNSKNPYPEVEIDERTYAHMYAASLKIAEDFSRILATNNKWEKSDIIRHLHEIIDPLTK